MSSSAQSRLDGLVLLSGLLAGLALGLVIFFGFPERPAQPAGASGASPSGQADTRLPAPIEGAPAPDFQLTDLEGSSLDLADLKGKVVLLNFWATWCEPCRVEMPAIQARQQQFADQGLVVLGVNFDEPEAMVVDFRDQLGLTFPILLDPGGDVQRLYRVLGYPTSFFVDRQGVIRVEHVGVMTEGQLDRYLAELGFGA